MTHLALAFLGSFRATLGDEPVSGLQSPRLQALLAYLAVETNRKHARRALGEMIWPNRPEGEALEALRYALSNLRTAIGDREAAPPFLHITRTTLRFNTASDYTLDVDCFQQQIASAESASEDPTAIDALESAVALYRGDFLEDLFLPDAVAFEEWILLQRELLARQMASALRRLVIVHERDGAYDTAQIWAEQRLRIEPWNEAAHRQLMRTLALSGQRARALVQYETCRQRLNEELGVEPGRATQALYQAIREGQLVAATRRGTTLEAPVPSTPLLAREEELARLEQFLGEVLAGQGRVVFVTGEAGSGKTALWRAFARRAMEAHGGLVVAAGQSSAQAGAGDPYLPFREILQTLTGDVEPQRAGGTITLEHARRLWAVFPDAAETVVTYGPGLVDRFVPGASFLSRAQAFAPSGSSWLPELQALVEREGTTSSPPGERQAALFEQVTRVLRRLARRSPMILVMDDLQWADRGSLSLLFHLGRRLAGSRILLVGAYRPGDVASRHDGDRRGARRGARHPLLSIVNELQRAYGEVKIDLDRTPEREFVDAYLDTEPNRLGDPFREALARHTGGNPLFTIEMLRALQARGDLMRDEGGRWVTNQELDWELLPARVEAVVAERVGHLSSQFQRTLGVASVIGETFTAEVVARAQEIDAAEILRRLDEPLSESHRLVQLHRVERLASGGRRLSHYQFRHVLFQKFVYRQLSEAERAYLHRRVGAAIEAVYAGEPERLASHAPQLAYHFQEAGAVERAIHYRQQAGEQAVRLSANEEAIQHFTQGLELLDSLPDTARRDAQELELLLALAAPLQAVRGYGAPETGRTYDRALALCQRMGDMPEVRPVLWLLGSFYTVRAEYDKALELHQCTLKLAEESGHALWVALAQWVLGSTLMYVGKFRRAAASLDHMVERYDPARHHALTRQLGQDPGVDSLTYSAWTLWFLGYPDQAMERGRRAVALANQLGHPLTQAFALGLNGVLYQLCRSPSSVRQAIAQMAPVVEEEGLRFYKISLAYLRGLCQAWEGEGWIGRRAMEQASVAWEATGAEMHRPHLMAWLAEVYGRAGEVERGLALLDEALALVEDHNERYFEAEIYRLRGELLVSSGDEARAEESFQRAIAVARQQEAKSWELRATMSLSRLWRRQGKADQARRNLEGVYEWFSEGFGTPDLRDARSLLDELSSL